MDLIDRTTLLQVLEWQGLPSGQPLAAERKAREMILSLPSQTGACRDTTELVHEKAYFRCAKCGNHFSIRMGQGNPRTWKFCPKCGREFCNGA